MRRILESGLRFVLLLPLLTSGCGENKPTAAPPHLSAYATPLGPCVVVGGSLTFDVVLESRGTPPYTYEWTFSDPSIPDATGQTPSVTFPNHGTVDVSLTMTDSKGETSASGTTVNVKNDCTPLVATITQPVTDITVPQGDLVDFAGTGAGGDPPYTYSWLFIKGGDLQGSSPATNTSFQFTQLGRYNVYFRVSDFAETVEDHRFVMVIPLSFYVTIDSPEDGSSQSANQNLLFSPTVTGGTGPFTFAWSFGAASGIPDSNEEFPTVTYATPGNYTVMLTVTDTSDNATAQTSIDIEIVDVASADAPVSQTAEIAVAPVDFGASAPRPWFRSAFGGGTAGVFLASDGAAIFDPAGVTFGGVIASGTAFFGGLAATPAGGPHTIVGFNFTETFVSTYDSGSGLWSAPSQLLAGTANAAIMVNDDATESGFVLTLPSSIKTYEFNTGSQQFELQATFPLSLFPGESEVMASAVALQSGGGMLVAFQGSPGNLYYQDGIEGHDATLIGALGGRPQRLHCLEGLCVVTNRLDDTASVIAWSGSASASIVDTFSTGNSPRGCDMMLLGNGNVAVVTADRNDNGYTVAELAPSGTVLSATSSVAPALCGSPGDVAWLRDGTTKFMITCLSGDNVFVLDAGL